MHIMWAKIPALIKRRWSSICPRAMINENTRFLKGLFYCTGNTRMLHKNKGSMKSSKEIFLRSINTYGTDHIIH